MRYIKRSQFICKPRLEVETVYLVTPLTGKNNNKILHYLIPPGSDLYDGFQIHFWAYYIGNQLKILKMMSKRLES